MAIVATSYECTHKEACNRIARWLQGTAGCAVVMTERVTRVSETPDAIGWKSDGTSILVECKVSRSDFHADKAKSFRRYEDSGVGLLRYYAAPRGILTPEDMPEGWGLLELSEHLVRVKKHPDAKQANKAAEVSMLVSAIRRLELAATVFVRHEEPQQSPNHQMTGAPRPVDQALGNDNT